MKGLTKAQAKKVKWTSSKKTIATVKNGKIKAIKAGTATITAKYTVGQPEEEGYDYGDFQESQPYEKYEEYKNH